MAQLTGTTGFPVAQRRGRGRADERGAIALRTWGDAAGRGVLIVAYFVITTVWLPNVVLKVDAIAEASNFLRDIVVLVVWGAALVGGVVMLRRAQQRNLI